MTVLIFLKGSLPLNSRYGVRKMVWAIRDWLLVQPWPSCLLSSVPRTQFSIPWSLNPLQHPEPWALISSLSGARRGGGMAGPWCLRAEQVATNEPARSTSPCGCAQPVLPRRACPAMVLYCCLRWWPPAPPQQPLQPQDMDIMQNTFYGSFPVRWVSLCWNVTWFLF